MATEVKTQVKVSHGVEPFWKALAMDYMLVIPQIIPNLVKNAEFIEGDGGLGTVILFTFGPNVPAMKYQKEKIVELDATLHRIAMEVVEGGHLNLGFSSYKTTFQLTALGEQETLVDLTVTYESEIDQESSMPSKTTASALTYVKCLENYLSNPVV
ncbi:hypothetical protein HS088_TW21G00156 [Tripterygium wilfordii]|uniref:Bet v I/Major latex protein domain-containing protein n=1 Tax=Tripterygium wilfordii TaxID=458696 RepID=A0A7J7C1K0_TRIWF|nr:phytohormone-binding protein-like [Tripterygium wilfordii]KAF5728014.1 hypothetical protein HS088_TW21G00156 [Tripterygium wilfordii]